MLRELIDCLRYRCAPGARYLGLAYESAAIAARYRRVGQAWTSHLDASKAAILQAAERCPKRERALVVGAGACLDVPVSGLARTFREVILADAVVTPEARRWERQFPGRVRAVAWDATGFLDKLARQSKAKVAKAEDVLATVDQAEPGVAPGGEADLTVSGNCLSQLGLVPTNRIAVDDDDGKFARHCAERAAATHLAWLKARTGVRVLLSDLARLDVAPDGREISRELIFTNLPLRVPDQSWRWNLAPIPEWSRETNRVHEVGAWVDGAG